MSVTLEFWSAAMPELALKSCTQKTLTKIPECMVVERGGGYDWPIVRHTTLQR